MSNIKCPFCGEKIEHIKDGWCNCKNRCTGSGSIELWLQFLRTRKALEIAVDALKSAHDYYEYCIQRDKDYGGDDINWDCTAMNMDNDISEALKQITALEQKDKQ